MIEMCVEGYACTVFAYGQTGSGKTHTITGPTGNVSSHRTMDYCLECNPSEAGRERGYWLGSAAIISSSTAAYDEF